MTSLRHLVPALAGIVALAGLAMTPASGAPPRPLATGGPDTFGYRYIDSNETGGPAFAWEDIGPTSSSPGTSLFGTSWDDTATTSVALGFTFPYYGANHTTVSIGSNGYAYFNASSWVNLGSYQFPSASVPYPAIGLFMGDLHSGSGAGQVLYRSITGGGNNRFIIQWHNVSHYSAQASSTYLMQIKIFATGLVVLNYNSMSGSFANGSNTSSGIQGNSTTGLSYLYNGSPGGNAISSNRAVNFSVGTAPNAPASPVHAATSGGPAQPDNFISDPTVYFRAQVSDPDVGQAVGLQVELLPSATPFNPTAVTGVLASSPLGASGATPEAAYVFTGTPYGNGTYHWRARAIDNFGMTSAWTTPVNDAFEVDIVAPGPVGILEPVQDAQARLEEPAGGPVNFSWDDPVDGGPAPISNYDVQAGTDPSFATTQFSVNVTTKTTQAVFVPDPPGTTTPRYWRVRANDSAGNLGAWSSAIRFYAILDSGRKKGAGDGIFGDKLTCAAGAGERGSAALGALVVLLGLGWGLRRR